MGVAETRKRIVELEKKNNKLKQKDIKHSLGVYFNKKGELKIISDMIDVLDKESEETRIRILDYLRSFYNKKDSIGLSNAEILEKYKWTNNIFKED